MSDNDDQSVFKCLVSSTTWRLQFTVTGGKTPESIHIQHADMGEFETDINLISSTDCCSSKPQEVCDNHVNNSDAVLFFLFFSSNNTVKKPVFSKHSCTSAQHPDALCCSWFRPKHNIQTLWHQRVTAARTRSHFCGSEVKLMQETKESKTTVQPVSIRLRVVQLSWRCGFSALTHTL